GIAPSHCLPPRLRTNHRTAVTYPLEGVAGDAECPLWAKSGHCSSIDVIRLRPRLCSRPKQQPENHCMCDEQRRHYKSRNVKRRAEGSRIETSVDETLVKCVKQIAGAPKVEQPHQRSGPGNSCGERESGNDRKHGRDLVAVGRGSGEGCRKCRRHDAG